MRAEVLPVVASHLREPTPQGALALLDSYLGNLRRRLFVLFDDQSGAVAGIVGLTVACPLAVTDPARVEISDLTVAPGRGSEIGQLLVSSLPTVFPCREILAEADEGSVDFFRRLGFVCDGPGEGEAHRYRCYIRLPEAVAASATQPEIEAARGVWRS
jgi:hypothetical protein